MRAGQRDTQPSPLCDGHARSLIGPSGSEAVTPRFPSSTGMRDHKTSPLLMTSGGSGVADS
jgi:hypothetical protein